MKCRNCGAEVNTVFADLGFSPISNNMLNDEELKNHETYYPLKAYVCEHCFLVQIDEVKSKVKIFNKDYTYFSSFSTTWVEHCSTYTDMMMKRFQYNQDSLVIEIASNDGCLLRNFLEYKVPVVGVDPTSNTALYAEKRNGVKTIVDFFSTGLANEKFVSKNRFADLIIGNNVLAHVPNINDFIRGMKIMLKEQGVITMEFPHLLKLIENCEFDTIYHEHFSYLSLITVINLFERQGLEIFDIDEIPTHGGSLRIYAKHKDNGFIKVSQQVNELLNQERNADMDKIQFYQGFQDRIDKIKYKALIFLIEKKLQGKKIIGYGAASKGNTFLNYCGIKGTDLIEFVVDASPYKQNKFLPGSHIPVVTEEKIKESKPDYVIIIPWNLKNEITTQLSYIKGWGGKFIFFIPKLTVI